MKYCIPCKRNLPLTEFWKNKHMKDGYQVWCKTCWKAVTDKRRNGPKREIELRQRQNRHLVRSYGITLEEYEALFTKQNGECAICHKKDGGVNQHRSKKLAVDHNHINNVVRGLLCENCNRGVGMFKDSVILLQKAINYLA